MLDIVIVNVPGSITKSLFAAPALLKAAIQSEGLTCKTIDFNILFYSTVDSDRITELENFFSTGFNEECREDAEQLVNQWANEIIKHNPVHLGISVFTYQNRIATRMLCECIKQKSSIKIILGGQGLTDGGILGTQSFAKELISVGLADFYIKSEGERALVELLKGNLNYPGINSDTFKQIEELDTLPIPDYSDYDLNLYSPKSLPITSSRGCVRSCSFCDIHDHWKYEYRSGKRVAEEMISLYERYNINEFFFTDSLVNGSLREFSEFCRIMAEYNVQGKIKWGGQYIVRSERFLSEKYWYDLARSGAYNLAIGVETGSDEVRTHMNKKFTNADLDYTMNMLDKFNITCVFLMIVGYPTETEKDFQDTLDMFDRYQHLANRIIINVEFGSTLGILPNTPLFNNAKEYNIELDKYENNWVAHNNPSLTVSERLRRVQYAKDYVRNLGFFVSGNADGILSIIERQLPTFEKRNKIKQMIRLKEMK